MALTDEPTGAKRYWLSPTGWYSSARSGNSIRIGYEIMFSRSRAFWLVAFALLSGSTVARGSGAPDPLFQDNGVLDVTLTGPLTTLIRERSADENLPGVFEYRQVDGAVVRLDIKIRTRGHFRRDNCKFPPLQLNFRKSQTDETLFDKQDKLKLVVHCDRSGRYQQSLLREYLAYRVLNTLTDWSFRVRLLRVTYVDSEEHRPDQTRFDFLIEHKNRLGKRHGMKEAKVEEATVDSIQPGPLNLTSLFQFFIANTDFSPIRSAPDRDCCHNYVLFEKDSEQMIPVPYDFDLSGFVNAQYAKPDVRFGLHNVRQRLYRGRCANNDYVADSLQQFRNNRETIFELVNQQVGLSSAVRKSIFRSMESFYKVIDEPREVERQLLGKCI